MSRRRWLAGAAGLLLILVSLGGLSGWALWQRLAFPAVTRWRLTGAGGGQCVTAAGLTPAWLSGGGAAELTTPADPVRVLDWFTRRGWRVDGAVIFGGDGQFVLTPPAALRLGRLEFRQAARLTYGGPDGTHVRWEIIGAVC
ncbi:MAG: hypothetical protein JNK29_07855 [Anaerolineales bacterium]|nr:hypothetical protein [Anaerolineales bacterium]